MTKLIRKLLSIYLAITLTILSVFSVSGTPVLADVPAVPTLGQSAPPPPSVNTSPPSVPTAGSAPTSPPAVPTQGDSVPTVPVAPTLGSQPTTSVISPTDTPSGTGDSASNPTPTDPAGTGGLTGASGTAGTDSTGNTTGAIGATGASGTDGSSSGSTTPSINDPANTGTGAFSTNKGEEKLAADMAMLNKNLATVQNKVDAITSTGFNYANLNTLSGSVLTGNSTQVLNLLNKLNSNMTGEGAFQVFNVYDTYLGDIAFQLADNSANGGFSDASGMVSKNAVTGAGSDNTADASTSFKVKEANGNDAKLTNDINIAADTGSNQATANTGDGSVKTGDATALGNIINMANTNLNVAGWLFGVVNIVGDMVGDIILPQNSSSGNTTTDTAAGVYVGNSDTGFNSNNQATLNSTLNETFDNANSAKVTSNVDVGANTGNNTASANTGGGSVNSGTSAANVSNSTVANTNTVDEEGTVWMVIVNEAGKWVGHIIGAPWGSTAASNGLPITQQTGGAGSTVYNAGTGPNSQNSSTYNLTSDTGVSNTNDASISNNITANANTGDNDASYNTGKGEIDTGDAKTGLNLVNMVNTNVTAKKFVAILVNVLGSWVGDVVTPGSQTQTTGNAAGNTTSNTTKSATGNTTANNTTDQTSNTAASPSPTPTVTVDPPFENTNIGGTGDIAVATPTPGWSDDDNSNQTQTVYYYYYYESQPAAAVDQGNAAVYPSNYQAAVNKLNNTKNRLTKEPYQPAAQEVQNQVNQLTRGVFISAAFAKATQSTYPAILLGGAKFKVTNTWLSIIPLAFIFFFLRRRRKFKINVGKYLNMILDIVL